MNIPLSYLALIVTNLITIAFASIQQWSIGEVMWIYFLQSVIIGIFNVAKMMSLQTFRTDGLRVNGQPVTPNSPRARNSMALFFSLHYGGFHLIYGLFLAIQHGNAFFKLLHDSFFILAFLSLLLNHFFSFIKNYKNDIHRNLNLGTLLFFPYARVFPMHLIIMISTTIGEKALIYFMLLKTIADLITHAVEHSMGKTQPAAISTETTTPTNN